MHKKSPKFSHNIGEKKSMFRKKDDRQETNIWAQKGGPSAHYPQVVSIDLAAGPFMAIHGDSWWSMVIHGDSFWRKRPSPTLEQNPNTDPKPPYTRPRASNSDWRSLAQTNSLKLSITYFMF